MFPERESIDAEAALRQLEAILGGANQGALERLQTMVRHMAADGVRRDQPMREVFARAGDKWSSLLLLLLSAGNFRHGVLRRLVAAVGAEGHISQRMLTLRLRSLERDGLIARTLIAAQPPGVEYSLTPLGAGLVQQLDQVMQWIRDHQAEIWAARARFAQAQPDEDDPEASG
ncbi:MAG: helix-turn-helix domain-containing protein [Steroidobacteraceae bacterium]